MRRPILTTICLISLTSGIGAQTELPAVRIKNLTGQQIAFSSIAALSEGAPVIVSFWASWCIPCITELNTISEQYEARQKQTPFKLLAISVDDTRTSGKVRSLVAGKGWPYDIYLDQNSELKRAFNINEIPYVMVLKNGKIIYQHTGYMAGNEEELFEAIKNN